MIELNEKNILRLLEKKHNKDIFVPYCKNGSTWWTKGLLILDAWVMKRSWAHPCVIGYEIKTSRSDFLSDTKWKKYLDYCNVFYFVCSPQMIKKEELPVEVGLYYTSKNIKRLFIQKPSKYRDVIIPEEIYRYILMCRAIIRNPGEY